MPYVSKSCQWMDSSLYNFLFPLSISQMLTQLERLIFNFNPLQKDLLLWGFFPHCGQLFSFSICFFIWTLLMWPCCFSVWLQVSLQELLNLLDEFCSDLTEGQKDRILRNNHAPTRSVNTDIMIEEWELNSCPDWANIIVSLGSWYSLAHPHLPLLALQGCCPWSGKETKLMQWGWRWAEGHREQVCWESGLAASSSPHRNCFVAKLNIYCFISNTWKAWLRHQMALFLWT